jgi:fructose-1,6-bisphosphatase II
MERNLALDAVRVTEAAALASARFMGRGDHVAADEAAVDAMRAAVDSIAINGTVVIGEGPEEAMAKLFDGEHVGTREGPAIEVALDAIEGAAACATGGVNALSAIALAEPGALLRAPDIYMEKIACGPAGRGVVDLEGTVKENLGALADAKGVYLEQLTVAVLDRPRHDRLIEEVRDTGARIKLVTDGDLAAALATTRPESGIDILMGSGRAPQGVLAAAGLACLTGEMQARFVVRNEHEAAQLRALGHYDPKRRLDLGTLVSGHVMLAATGVTSGDFLKGVRYVHGGAVTSSIVMRSASQTIRTIESLHHFDREPEYARLPDDDD